MVQQKNNNEKTFREDILSLRKDLVKLCLLAIPTTLVTLGTNWLKETFISQPWQAIFIIIPLIIIGWFIWRRLHYVESFKLSGMFLWFFIIYILIFSVAAGTRFLDWQRTPVGYTGSTPRNWLALNSLGDWRYWFVNNKPIDNNLIVITMDPPKNKTLNEMRFDLIRLIKLAEKEKAKGIAFDFFLKKTSEVDPLLCQTISEASQNNLKVFFGYNFILPGGRLTRDLIAESLTNCIPPEGQGHLVGYADWDNKVRSIPLYFAGNTTLPSLSYQFANTFYGTKIKEKILLQFVKPLEDPPIYNYMNLVQDKNLWALLRDSYILVGELSDEDSFETPFGKLPGVLIHTYAVHSLFTNQYIQHSSILLNLFVVYALCLVLAFSVSKRMNIKKLLMINVLMTILVIILSILAIYFWLIWFDVIYPIIAIWIFLPLLIGLRKIKN